MTQADPQDLSSEEALLGAILVSPAVGKKVDLDSEAFYKPRHGVIWDAAVKCANNGGCDPITVAAELERRGELSRIGGREKLSALAALTPAPGNAKAYARRIKEKAELRTVRKNAKALLRGVDDENSSLIDTALADLGHPMRLVDTGSGEVIDQCPQCTQRESDRENLERENTKLLRKIRRLESDREKERQGDPNRQLILSLIERWKRATGHTRSNANSADRFDLIKARLKEGYEPKDLELAIDGIGCFRYVVNGTRVRDGKRSQRHDRLGIALGGGEAVERFANLGAQARKQGFKP